MASKIDKTNTVNIVSLNMGGSEHNPFEYYPYETIDDTIKEEWNYRKTLSGLTINGLKGYLKNIDKRYEPFRDYLNKFDNIDILDYFFPVLGNTEETEKILELENKFGRSDSKIKRFNPIEFGYDPVYFMTDVRTQYIYMKECAKKNLPVSELLMKCLEVPFLNKKFSLTNTIWLNQTYDMVSVYNIILYDMMKTYAVYTNYKLFDQIYVSRQNDNRLIRLMNYLNNEPSIIVTQEGGFNYCHEGLKLVYSNPIQGGIKIYTYKLDYQFRLNNITPLTNKLFGNNKGVDIEFIINNKILRIVGVHCKEPKGMRTYHAIVESGIKELFETKKSILNYMRKFYDWYYDINEKYEIVIGDFNPKDNTKVKLIREKLGVDYKMYPENEENTTRKIRSGYCAQYKKFWKKSLVCKDLLICRNKTEIENFRVFPEVNELLTNNWLGDHSSIIAKLNMN